MLIHSSDAAYITLRKLRENSQNVYLLEAHDIKAGTFNKWEYYSAIVAKKAYRALVAELNRRY